MKGGTRADLSSQTSDAVSAEKLLDQSLGLRWGHFDRDSHTATAVGSQHMLIRLSLPRTKHQVSVQRDDIAVQILTSIFAGEHRYRVIIKQMQAQTISVAQKTCAGQNFPESTSMMVPATGLPTSMPTAAKRQKVPIREPRRDLSAVSIATVGPCNET